MNNVYLSLGSNIDDREQYLYDAYHLIKSDNRVYEIKRSSIYETEPVGYLDQESFLNMAIYIKTDYSPFEVLDLCASVEKTLNRKRLIRWGPRTIDVDILLFNEEIIKEADLIIPHERMLERAFVLVPLKEIFNGSINDKSIDYYFENIDKSGVEKYNEKIEW